MSKEKNLKPFEKVDYVDIMILYVQICPIMANTMICKRALNHYDLKPFFAEVIEIKTLSRGGRI